jgi:hypothetical protein
MTLEVSRVIQAALRVCEWAWGTPPPAEILSAAGTGVRVLLLADVVYDPDGYEPLLHTLHDVLHPLHPRAEGGAAPVAIMAHRSRHPDQHVRCMPLATSAIASRVN